MKSIKLNRRNRIRRKIRGKVFGQTDRPRLSIFRSNKEIYAQIIDDSKGHTLLSCSSLVEEMSDLKGTKLEISKQTGKILAEKAVAAGIKSVVFDRGGYLYHGRVKALADAARENGLVF